MGSEIRRLSCTHPDHYVVVVGKHSCIGRRNRRGGRRRRADKSDKDRDGEDKDEDSNDEDGNKNKDVKEAEERTAE